MSETPKSNIDMKLMSLLAQRKLIDTLRPPKEKDATREATIADGLWERARAEGISKQLLADFYNEREHLEVSDLDKLRTLLDHLMLEWDPVNHAYLVALKQTFEQSLPKSGTTERIP